MTFLLRKCHQLEEGEDMWLRTIKDIRNKVAHAVSTTDFDQGRLVKWWEKLEGSVLGLAGKVGFRPYAKSIEDQIKLLKIVDLDRNEVDEFLCQIREENKKVSGDIRKEHNETRKHFDQGIKDLEYRLVGQGFKDLEDHIVGRILQRINPHNPAATTHRKDIQFIEASCQVTGENIDEELMIRNLNKQEQLDKVSDFSIKTVKRNCIILELSASTDIFQTTDTFHEAVRTVIERIIQAGEIQSSQQYTIKFDLAFNTQLTEDEQRIVSSLTTLQMNTGFAQDGQTEYRQPSIFCDLCHKQKKEVNALSWCPECNVALCMDCTSDHREQQPAKDHHAVHVYFKTYIQHEIENQEYCREHAGIPVGYYCPVHDFICCSVCLDDKHKPCEGVISLDEACESADKFIEGELSEIINNINRTVASIQEETNKNASDINTECHNIESKIVLAKTKTVDRITKIEKKLLSELQLEKERAIRKQHDVNQQCKKIAERSFNHSIVMQFVEGHGTKKQAFLLAHYFRPTVQELDDSVSEILKSATIRKHVIPLGSKYKSEQSLHVKHTPIKQKFAQCIVPRADKPLTSFKLISVFRTPDRADISGMIVTEDNKLLLCSNTEKCEILVYNDDGRYVTVITMNQKPYDIAVMPGGDQCVVTLPVIQSIQYVNSKDLTPGSAVKLPITDRIHGIAVDEQYIYVAGFDEIFVLNIEGSVVRTIDRADTGHVYCLVVKDNIYYTSSARPQIQCIDQNGLIQQTKVIDVGFKPTFAIDKHGHIYVGGEESGKLYRLDKDLKENMTIGDDSRKSIGAICFNKNCTKLFVACEKGTQIAVFNCS